jgi:hypothetical protein
VLYHEPKGRIWRLFEAQCWNLRVGIEEVGPTEFLAQVKVAACGMGGWLGSLGRLSNFELTEKGT